MSIHSAELPADRTELGHYAPAGRASSASGLKRYRWWLLAGGVVVLGAIAAAVLMRPGAKPAAPAATAKVSTLPVTVSAVVVAPVTRTLLVTGSLAAFDDLPIGTETSGLALAEVLVDIGDTVKKGQLLARFNDSVLKADLAEKEALLAEAKGNVVEAEANYTRAQDLVRTGAMSARDLDNRRALAISMRSRVGVAEANRDLSMAKLKQSEVRAPSDGTITARTARIGAVMSAGGTELFRMIRDNRVELVAEVPETDMMVAKAGQAVNIVVDGDNTAHHYTGTVRVVEPTVDSRTRLGHLRIDLERNPDLRPGMFVSGRVAVGVANALVVPESAVVYREVRPIAFVVDDKGIVTARNVATGARQDGNIAILSGVKVGERVVLSGAGYLKDGDQVTVVDKIADTAVKPLPAQQ
ncbi:efflux RND transporter periplasmic adaptor subunit [Nitrospirillum iridis]|uniref:RND family efflux transporter MFP subunit n=1 Tax=Nitrospirillum iridis TaxID=765888 RepID=A0A7X0B1Q4_9PROT|nr:efflux RND transporter periplasmic adaptor subunit [Nitrospirillum iridis]MBB6254149.1 RND family efflux transporter MFP subunit [Nitrospirillum iridis]